jgi:hypothetical protein
VSSLELILYSPVKVATPPTNWPIATELPAICVPRPTAIQMPVAAGTPGDEAVSVVVFPDFENVTSRPPTVWHVADLPAHKQAFAHNRVRSAGRARHHHLLGKQRLRRARSRPEGCPEASPTDRATLTFDPYETCYEPQSGTCGGLRSTSFLLFLLFCSFLFFSFFVFFWNARLSKS